MPGKRKHTQGSYPVAQDKIQRTSKALSMVSQNEVSIRKAALETGLSVSYLKRRISGECEVGSRNGPAPVFNREEEERMARWLVEMAKRGVGLQPREFLDFVQKVINQDKRKTCFQDGRPGRDWYRKFMTRNAHIVGIVKEKPLEFSRSKLTTNEMDRWFSNYREFLISKDLLDKPERIWNADECGFSMGSKAGKVIGPVGSQSAAPPHVTGSNSKERLTGMFCCNADGTFMPPFLVYPSPAPKGCNPLNGSIKDTVIEYTKKGWMDLATFMKFLDHFDKHCGAERPVALIIDSVSSHIDIDIFQAAVSKGIEIYRLVPNATHLLQPLDRGVFGPLKTKWYQVTRNHYRENPGSKIGKANFAEKLKEAYQGFYRPSTVVNSFKATGVYPVDRSQISDNDLKPGLTYTTPSSDLDLLAEVAVAQPEVAVPAVELQTVGTEQNVSPLLEAMTSFLQSATGSSTEIVPVVQAMVNFFSTGSMEVLPSTSNSESRQVEEALPSLVRPTPRPSTRKAPTETTDSVSPVLEELLVYPTQKTNKIKPRRLLDSLPDNVTSKESIRQMALRDLKKTKEFAEREKKARARYTNTKNKKTKKTTTKQITEMEAMCMACEITWLEDQENCRTWVECDGCSKWIHVDCIPVGFEFSLEDDFICHYCL